MSYMTKSRCLHEWADRVCANLTTGVALAKPTGNDTEPTAVVEFSVEVLRDMLEDRPDKE